MSLEEIGSDLLGHNCSVFNQQADVAVPLPGGHLERDMQQLPNVGIEPWVSLNVPDGRRSILTRQGIERVRSILELNPDDNRALNMGAFALLRLGQVEEATGWMLTSMKNARRKPKKTLNKWRKSFVTKKIQENFLPEMLLNFR